MFKNKKEFYNSDEFISLKEYLSVERKNPDDGLVYCEHCGRPIIKKYDMIAHHKKELTEQNINDYMISLNPDLIMLVHFKCHNEIHRRFGKEGYRNVYIVYGPPCSGKTTFVQNNAGPNDLIVDMDSIYQMITTDRLKMNAFAVRDCLYEQIKYRTGKWENAYVIAGLPMAMERQRLEIRLNASSVFIDVDADTCKARAQERSNAEETIKYIEEWFSMYTT